MNFQANAFTVILLLAALHGIVLGAFLLFYRKGDRIANAILGVLVIVFSVNFGLPKLIREYYLQLPHIIALTFPLPFLIGPLLYLYASRLVSGVRLAAKQQWLHFIPFLAIALYMMPFYLMTGAEKIEFVQQLRMQGQPLDWLILSGLRSLHLLAYLVAVFSLLKAHSRRIKNVFSSIEKIHLGWLRYLVFGLGCIWLVQFVLYLGFVFRQIVDPYILADYVSSYSMAVFVYTLGYMGLTRPEVFSGLAAAGNGFRSRKYERSGLSPENAEAYSQKLLAFMDSEKPHRDSELTLNKLADALAIPPNHLSQVINEKLQQNFFDFVNRYRVDEVRGRLTDPDDDQLTILALAYEAGFNSKSAFYTAFQKHTGTTPSRLAKTARAQTLPQ